MFLKKFNYFELIYTNIIILLFLIPILIFGISDQEEYQLGLFSNSVLFQDLSHFFLNYFDLYGPGINFPIGNLPKLHPANFFLDNLRIFYFFYIYINIGIYIFFIKKIIKLFNSKSKNVILIIIPIAIFAIPNFNYIYSDDWPNANFLFCFYSPIFYYCIKFIKKNNNKNFYKFIFFISFQFANGGIGFTLIFYFFIFLILLFNKKADLFKNRLYYIGFTIFIFCGLEYLYFTYSEFIKFSSETNKIVQPGYTFVNYFLSLFSPFYNQNFPINRLPGYGVFLFLISFICIKNIYNKKIQLFYLDYLFIIFFIISLLSKNTFTYFISAIWFARDVLTYIAIVIFAIILKKKLINKYFIFIILIHALIFYSFNVFKISNQNEDNFILNKNKNSEINLFLKEMKFDKTQINRLYLSPKVNTDVRYQFRDQGIFAITDFIKFYLYPFNGWFKNVSLENVDASISTMHGYIGSSYKLINNENFFNLFQIKYLIIYEDEKNKIDLSRFKLIKSFKTKKDKILLLQIKNNYILSFNKIDNLIKKDCSEKIKLYCLLKLNKLDLSSISIKRINTNKYEINNFENKNIKILFPFNNSKYWNFYFNNINDKKLISSKVNFENFSLINIPSNTKLIAIYKNNLIFYLKIFSMLSLFILFLYSFIGFKKK